MKARVALMTVSGLALALSLFLPASTALAAGTTRYVRTTGANVAPCSSTHPCKTIVFAIGTAVAGDTINVGAGTFNENVTVYKNLTIVGAGAGKTIVDGGAKGTVFTISASMSASIQSLRIRNGKAVAATSNQGGGVFVSGSATLSLTSVKITGSTAHSGGGIANYGTLTTSKVTISGNNATMNTGGGLANNGTAYVNITDIVNNNTSLIGGGIFNAQSGTLTVNASAVHGNTSTNGGYPGIYNSGTATITNTTISGNVNTVGLYEGAGLFQDHGSSTLNFVTISANSAAKFAAITASGGTVTVKNSIIYGNGAGNQCLAGGGTYSDGGYNVFADTSCGTGGTGDKVTNPQLKPLGSYGGFTPTQALKSTSPAINMVPLARCVAKDQRGVSRPQGSKCDAGAYEYP
jgi:hypothetical protein